MTSAATPNAANLLIRVLSPSLTSPAIAGSASSATSNGSVHLAASLSVLSPLASPTGKPMYRVHPYATVAHLKRAIAANVDQASSRSLVPSNPDSVSLVFSGRVLADDEPLGEAFARFLPDISEVSASDTHADDPLVLTVHALIRPAAPLGSSPSAAPSASSLSFSSRLSDAFATNTVLFAPQPGSSAAVTSSASSSASWLSNSGPASGPSASTPSSASFSSVAPAGTSAALPRPRFTSTPASMGSSSSPTGSAANASIPPVFLPSSTLSPAAVPHLPPQQPAVPNSFDTAPTTSSVVPPSPLAATPGSAATNPMMAQWHQYYNDYYRQYYTTQLQAILAARESVAATATGSTAHPAIADQNSALRHRAAPGDAPTATPAPTAAPAAHARAAHPQHRFFTRLFIHAMHALIPAPRARGNNGGGGGPRPDPLVHARNVARNLTYAIIKWVFVRQLLERSVSPALHPYLDWVALVGMFVSAGVLDLAGIWRQVAAWLVSGSVAAPAPAPAAAAVPTAVPVPQDGQPPQQAHQLPRVAEAAQPPAVNGTGAVAVIASFFVSMVPGSHPLDPATTAAEHLRAMDAFEQQEGGGAAAAAAAGVAAR